MASRDDLLSQPLVPSARVGQNSRRAFIPFACICVAGIVMTQYAVLQDVKELRSMMAENATGTGEDPFYTFPDAVKALEKEIHDLSEQTTADAETLKRLDAELADVPTVPVDCRLCETCGGDYSLLAGSWKVDETSEAYGPQCSGEELVAVLPKRKKDQYDLGAAGDNHCDSGYNVVENEEMNQTHAMKICSEFAPPGQWKWFVRRRRGIEDSGGNDNTKPMGCFMVTSTKNYYYNIEPKGSPSPFGQPLCQVAAARLSVCCQESAKKA